MRTRWLWAAVSSGVVLSLVVSYRLASQSIVFGSREGGWAFPYVAPFEPRSMEIFFITAVLSSALLVFSWKSTHDWPVIGGWCVLATALQGLLRSQTPFSFYQIFVNDSANSFLSVALKYDSATILRQFEQLRQSWPLHAQSNLPGKILLVQALTHVSTNAGVLAWIVVGISNLGGGLLYVMTRDLFGNRRLALLAVVFYLFMPGKLFFFPLLNTVTPVVVLVCGCLLSRWVATGRVVYAVLLGVSIYGLVLFEPGALAVGLPFAVVMGQALFDDMIPPRTMAWQTAAGVAAFAVTYILLSAGFGFDLSVALRQVAQDAAQFNVQARRPYEIWIRQNILDFAFGTGICQSFLIVAAVASRDRRAALFSGSLLVTLAVVDLIGVNRGEVTRLWIFLGCLFQIPSACIADELDTVLAATVILCATLLQDALGCAMVGFIVPG